MLWPEAGWSASGAAQPPEAGRAVATPDSPTAEEGADTADEQGTAVEGVEVVAHRDYAHSRGAVIGDVKPEVQYNAAQIQAFGVSTVNDLLAEIEPETHSDRGHGSQSPVVLLNGRRISSLTEIINFPTEAILRVDILPEEAALKYGYPADQRVVNIVLRRHFHATLAGLDGGGSTDGGDENGQAELDLLHVRHDARLNLDLKYKRAADVLEADRGISEPAPSTPYDLAGNVVSYLPGGEIDPALSALVGRPVTVAGVPAVAAGRPPTLGDFVATAGVPNVTNQGTYRSLAPATQSMTVNAVLARPVFGGINATFNASVGALSSDSLRGLPGVKLLTPAGDPFSPFGSDVAVDRYIDSPLHQYIDSWSAHLGSTLNKDVRDWRLSLTNAYDHADTQTDTDAGVDSTALQARLNARSATVNPFGPLGEGLVSARPQTVARSISDQANVQVLASGPILRLPPGNLYVSIKAGDTQSRLSSKTTSMRLSASASELRNDGSGQISIDLPLASRQRRFLPALGELFVNANGSIDQLSDFGTLKSFGYGVNWTPIPGYNLLVSYTNDETAPTPQALGNAAVSTPGVRVFDYATGQTVEITQVNGGNRNLLAEKRNVLKIGLTVKPLPSEDLTLVANYIKSDVKHPIFVIPAVYPAFETAFPDRFVRDAAGELKLEDDRPVNLAKAERSEIRWGVTFARRFGGPAPAGPLARADVGRSGEAHGAPATPGEPAQPSGAGRYKGLSSGASGGHLQFAIYHTIYLIDREMLQPGGPVLDLLNGGPASNKGGQFANEIEAQLGVSYHGVGGRFTADWREGSVVQSPPGSPGGDLTFSDLTTLNLRLFDNLGQQRSMVARYPWLRAARISLNVTNLLDRHIQVRDAHGVTPSAYQAGYLDPFGRTISLSFRKLFF